MTVITLTLQSPDGVTRHCYFQREVIVGQKSRAARGRIDLELPAKWTEGLGKSAQLIFREDEDGFSVLNRGDALSILLNGEPFRQAPLENGARLQVGRVHIDFEGVRESKELPLEGEALEALLDGVEPLSGSQLNGLLETLSVQVDTPRKQRSSTSRPGKRARVLSFVVLAACAGGLWLYLEQPRRPSSDLPVEAIPEAKSPLAEGLPSQSQSKSALMRGQLEQQLRARRQALDPDAERIATLILSDTLRPDPNFSQKIQDALADYEKLRAEEESVLRTEVSRLAQQCTRSIERGRLRGALQTLALENLLERPAPAPVKIDPALTPSYVGEFLKEAPLEEPNVKLLLGRLESALSQYVAAGQTLRHRASVVKGFACSELEQSLQKKRLDAISSCMRDVQKSLPVATDDDAAASKLNARLHALCERLGQTVASESQESDIPTRARVEALLNRRDELVDLIDRLAALLPSG